MAAPPALAQHCLSDAQIDQAIGAQIRAGAFTVDTRNVPDKPRCSGRTLAQQIQRIRADAFPPPPPVAIAPRPAAPALARREMVQTVQADARQDAPVRKPIAIAPAPRPNRQTATVRTVKSAAPAPAPVRSTAYYRSCREARAAGAAPIRRGQPGYGKHLDRDGDGIACE